MWNSLLVSLNFTLSLHRAFPWPEWWPYIGICPHGPGLTQIGMCTSQKREILISLHRRPPGEQSRAWGHTSTPCCKMTWNCSQEGVFHFFNLSVQSKTFGLMQETLKHCNLCWMSFLSQARHKVFPAEKSIFTQISVWYKQCFPSENHPNGKLLTASSTKWLAKLSKWFSGKAGMRTHSSWPRTLCSNHETNTHLSLSKVVPAAFLLGPKWEYSGNVARELFCCKISCCRLFGG